MGCESIRRLNERLRASLCKQICDTIVIRICGLYFEGFIRLQTLRQVTATLWPPPPCICREVLPRRFDS